MLIKKDSNLEFLLALDPEEAVKDDVKNNFITKHVIPFIKKVDL
jgi:hypothetical protein